MSSHWTRKFSIITDSNTIFGDIDVKWSRTTKQLCIFQLMLGCWFGTQVRLSGQYCWQLFEVNCKQEGTNREDYFSKLMMEVYKRCFKKWTDKSKWLYSKLLSNNTDYFKCTIMCLSDLMKMQVIQAKLLTVIIGGYASGGIVPKMTRWMKLQNYCCW